jgi:uncharacterized protein YqkB
MTDQTEEKNLGEVVCIDVGIHGRKLTRGRKYQVIAVRDKYLIRIKADTGGIQWYMSDQFAPADTSVVFLKRFEIEGDSLTESISSVEVTVHLSDEKTRWCFFVTSESLPFAIQRYSKRTYFNPAMGFHYGYRNMIFVSHISEETIAEALHFIDSQDQLVECTCLCDVSAGIESDPEE